MCSASMRRRSANCLPTLKRDTQHRRIARGERFKRGMPPSIRRGTILAPPPVPLVSPPPPGVTDRKAAYHLRALPALPPPRDCPPRPLVSPPSPTHPPLDPPR